MKFVLALLFLAGLAFATEEQPSGPNPDPAADAYYRYYGGYPGYYGGYGRYYGGYYGGYGGYGWGRKKREADPAVLATTHAAPAVVPHLGYGLGHLGYAYGAPYLHHAVPHTYTVAHKDAVVTPGAVDVKVSAPAAVYAGHFGYGLPWGYGYPVLAAPAAAEPAVADARKKRDAEAEPEADAAADAYYGYYGHPGYYGGYGRYYGGYYGRGYGYGYGRYYGWGK